MVFHHQCLRDHGKGQGFCMFVCNFAKPSIDNIIVDVATS